MSLFRTNIKKFVDIKYIIYNDFINLKTEIKIPYNDKIIDGEYIKEKDLLNIKNDYIGRILKIYDNDYYIHKNHLKDVSTKLKEEIKKNTYFENSFEIWNITKLVRKYNITGKDIFLSMTKNNEEFNQKWLEKEVINDYKRFDYCNHTAIKNSFSTDINKNETTLNLRRYVERGNFNGYKQLINMLEEKIKEEPNYNNLLLSNLIKEDEKINNNKKIDNEIIIPTMDLKGRTLSYFNQNDNECKIKEHKEFYDMIINGKNKKIFNLSNYFSYNLRPNYDLLEIDEKDLNNYILTPRNKTELSNLSIINCIIFGEDNIRFEDINKLMTLVRFKSIHYSVILDNINILHYDGQRIKINSDDKELNEMKFCKYQDILECCKWLIQIMNNINPELINHHNYHILVEYCKKYDNYYEQRFHNLINYEKYRIEKINFE